MAKVVIDDARCESKHPRKGTQCGIPLSVKHDVHSNGTQVEPWLDERLKYKPETKNNDGEHDGA